MPALYSAITSSRRRCSSGKLIRNGRRLCLPAACRPDRSGRATTSLRESRIRFRGSWFLPVLLVDVHRGIVFHAAVERLDEAARQFINRLANQDEDSLRERVQHLQGSFLLGHCPCL